MFIHVGGGGVRGFSITNWHARLPHIRRIPCVFLLSRGHFCDVDLFIYDLASTHLSIYAIFRLVSMKALFQSFSIRSTYIPCIRILL